MTAPELLEHVERTTADHVSASIVWLHGLGADGNDFVPLVDELTRTAPCGVRFIFPHAPAQPVTVNGGMTMPAWYDIRGLGDGIDEDEAGIATARGHVEALVQRERDRGVPTERILLAGFSQGAATAIHAALSMATPPGGVVALSGWMPAGTEAGPGAAGLPVFMAHGTEDPVVPIQLGRHAASQLQAAGAALDWHEYAMEHAVCLPQIQELDAWLAGRLG